MAYKYDYSRYNNKNGIGTGSTGAKKEEPKCQAPRNLVSISMRDNRVGCFSETSASMCHSKFYNDSTLGALEELNTVLDRIPTNAEGLADSISIIYIPNVIVALITGLGDYIRLGKTSSGFELGQDKIDMFMEVDSKIKDRSLNLNIRSYSMCSAEFGQKAKAWITEECKDANAEKDGVVRTKTTVTGAVNPAIEALNKQMVELITAGKFDDAQKVAQILATLNGAGASTPQAEEPAEEPQQEVSNGYAVDELED